MMNRQFLAVLVVALLAVAGGTALGVIPESIVLVGGPTLLGDGTDFPGMWEYVYDVHSDASPVDRVTLSGFDASATDCSAGTGFDALDNVYLEKKEI